MPTKFVYLPTSPNGRIRNKITRFGTLLTTHYRAGSVTYAAMQLHLKRDQITIPIGPKELIFVSVSLKDEVPAKQNLIYVNPRVVNPARVHYLVNTDVSKDSVQPIMYTRVPNSFSGWLRYLKQLFTKNRGI